MSKRVRVHLFEIGAHTSIVHVKIKTKERGQGMESYRQRRGRNHVIRNEGTRYAFYFLHMFITRPTLLRDESDEEKEVMINAVYLVFGQMTIANSNPSYKQRVLWTSAPINACSRS